MKQKWFFTEEIKYEADELNSELKFAYWEGHRDFVYDLINYIEPERVVELGSQYGCSLFTICQSVKNNRLKTEINAADFWKGDIGAQATGEEIFNLVQQTINNYYSSLNIKLYQMDFDSALNNFSNESVDIIHIDGGHRFEDVDHDFKTWLPKLKKNGIILFHDVYSHIDEGSCKHWDEIKQYYTDWFEFKHSCGLGVLFPKGDFYYKNIIKQGFLEKYHNLYYFRALYVYKNNRFNQLKKLYEDRYLSILKQNKMIDERDATIKNMERIIEDRDKSIKSMTKMIDERDVTIKDMERIIKDRDEAIESMKKMIDERYVAIQEQSRMIDERDATIKDMERMIKDRDEAIKNMKPKFW